MATGETTSGALAAALPAMVADARLVNEQEGTYLRTTDIKRQTPNTGLNWTEFALDQLSNQSVSETTDNQNFQLLSGTLLSVEPQMTQIIIKITDRTFRKIASIVKDKFGSLAGNAMARRKDEDYLALFAGFGTGASPGTGNPLSHGHISAAANRIPSNATEGSFSEIFTVLHGYQVYDIETEVRAPVGTYNLNGLTEEVFRRGLRGQVGGSTLFVDGNITIDSTPDANGATHSRDAVVAAIGMEIKKETDRDLHYGGGADVISMVEEYAFVERSSGNWAFRHFSDATAPTS